MHGISEAMILCDQTEDWCCQLVLIGNKYGDSIDLVSAAQLHREW